MKLGEKYEEFIKNYFKKKDITEIKSPNGI